MVNSRHKARVSDQVDQLTHITEEDRRERYAVGFGLMMVNEIEKILQEDELIMKWRLGKISNEEFHRERRKLIHGEE